MHWKTYLLSPFAFIGEACPIPNLSMGNYEVQIKTFVQRKTKITFLSRRNKSKNLTKRRLMDTPQKWNVIEKRKRCELYGLGCPTKEDGRNDGYFSRHLINKRWAVGCSQCFVSSPTLKCDVVQWWGRLPMPTSTTNGPMFNYNHNKSLQQDLQNNSKRFRRSSKIYFLFGQQ